MHRSRVACAGGLVLAFCLQSIHGSSLLAQGNARQSERADPVRSRRVTTMSADDHGSQTDALPRPDLVPQRVCLAQRTSGQELRVLVANRGSVDADSFSVGLIYGYERADTLLGDLRGIGGLAVGRSAWFSYGASLANGGLPATYTVLVDPRYTFQYQGPGRDGGTNMGTSEVAARIPEANEQNNTLIVTRGAIADCARVRRQGATPIPVTPR
jgi:hypothetical protein